MKRQSTWSITLGAAILVAGLAGMLVLFQFRKPPAEAVGVEERKLDVRVEVASPIDHTVTIEGFGTARPAVSVTVTPEVSGRVVYVGPDVKIGERVSAGDLLIRLDPQRYESLVAEREAQVGQIRAEIERLKTSQTNDRGRLGALERTRDLARAQFERARQLLEENVGNQLDVDRSEQSYNEAADALRRLQSVLSAYPLQIDEAQKRLAAAQAGLARATLDLERTTLYAPFSGRIDSIFVNGTSGRSQTDSAAIAVGHFAEAGRPLLVLADDRRLEVPIKLDSRHAYEWLQRVPAQGRDSVQPVACTVTWSENEDGPSWTGLLDRIETYDAESRTITAVVEVQLDDNSDGFPLAQGMFCRVRVPGRTLEHVFAVPQSAISVDGSVYIAANDRLESRPVHVAHTEGSVAYVDEGIVAGDRIVTTRLVNPIEGSLLRVASNETE